MNKALRIIFIGLFLLLSYRCWSASLCGGPIGESVVLGNCVNDCNTNRKLPGAEVNSDSCYKYCNCSCQLDKDALKAQANEILTSEELKDSIGLADKVCEARAWPNHYKLPAKFQGEHFGAPKEEIKRMFERHTWDSLYGGFDRTDPLVIMLQSENRQGPELLQCLYPNQKGGFVAFHFWPNVVPSNIEDLLRADKTGKLRFIGRTAKKHCPAAYDEALKLRKASMKETGFPPR